MSIAVVAALAIFLGILYFLYGQQQKKHTLSRLVLFGLVLGSAFGLGLQLLLGEVMRPFLKLLNGLTLWDVAMLVFLK